MKNKYNLFLHLIQKMFLVYLLLLSVFMIFRTYILFSFGNFKELKNFKLPLLKAFYAGFKFDTSVIAYGLLPMLLLIVLFVLLYKESTKLYLIKKIIRIYSIFIGMLFLVVSVIDYFFYKFFQAHINPVIFGIKNDKTTAVLASIWNDYPVLKVSLLLIICFVIFSKTTKYIFRLKELKKYNLKFSLITILLILALYFIAIRGSLGKFPLKLNDTTISTNTFVNELVLNGPFALKIANSLHKEHQIFSINTKETLQKNGFKNKKEALELYFDNKENTLLHTTNKNDFLHENPPNVVFILVEGFGKHYFDLHTKENNLLGSLEAELPYLDVFKNILSARNGTIETMENIMVGTPQSPISQSSYFNINYKSSVANPFKKNGYQTTYLTGDNLGWRNSGKFVKAQNFDDVLGYSFLKEKFKNPEEFTWGIHDEYLYNHIFDILNTSKKPQFIFTLTISNHTPNDVPSTFKQRPIKLSKEVLAKKRTTKDYVYKNFVSYQYAGNALGKIIHKIRTSPLGKNTIIVATGDHNVRGMFNYTTDELFLKRSVPILMYIPDNYKSKNALNLQRFGSHKDIFPTLFNLALSETSYINTGHNLLKKTSTKNTFFGENAYNLAGNNKGVIYIDGKAQYYKWKDTINFKGLEPTTKEKSPELYKLHRKMEAHKTLMLLQIQEDIINSRK